MEDNKDGKISERKERKSKRKKTMRDLYKLIERKEEDYKLDVDKETERRERE